MYKKEINILRIIVHQVGFIYKIIQGCTRLYRAVGQQNIKLFRLLEYTQSQVICFSVKSINLQNVTVFTLITAFSEEMLPPSSGHRKT
jgi:hypothetical protein